MNTRMLEGEAVSPYSFYLEFRNPVDCVCVCLVLREKNRGIVEVMRENIFQ